MLLLVTVLPIRLLGQLKIIEIQMFTDRICIYEHRQSINSYYEGINQSNNQNNIVGPPVNNRPIN